MDSDEKNQKTGFRDVIAVDLNNKAEVAHWLEHWSITEAELKEAVANTDTNLVSAIAAYLKK
ncbi:DUF3606 domain-containing protein [Flavobacterium sp.]|uniref:DUF3606 domain-containing protein n=1 Tax=Flavobacterium sp. TaxID=239 RepID=UPI0026282A3B|nr:DUF3606 domain-containing protein [Flavobacterium sp.]